MGAKRVGFLAALVILSGGSTAWAAEATPASFSLAARGTLSQGVTVKPVMKKRRSIGLVVFTQPKHSEVGTVVLGTFSGRPSIHWNLRVHGRVLGSGSYVVSLRVFADGKPTNMKAPTPRKLTISGQHVRVS